jgi:hypothetical protein
VSNTFDTSKEVSIDQSVFNLINLLVGVHLYDVKPPQTSILPSFWMLSVIMVQLNPLQMSKVLSINQPVFNLIILLAGVQLYHEN